LKLSKSQESKVNFTDGLYFTFQNSKPEYLSFEYSSTNTNIEDTNIRLFKDNVRSFVNFKAENAIMNFRCGFNGLLRFNFQQVIDFYNSTVSKETTDHTDSVNWRRAEMTIDWENKAIYFYYDGEKFITEEFYDSDIQEVNGLMIYNLHPGTTSFIKNLDLRSKPPAGRLISSLLFHLPALCFLVISILN
jgi:hypothetical protein